MPATEGQGIANAISDLRLDRKQDISCDRELARADVPNPTFREIGESRSGGPNTASIAMSDSK